MKKKGLQKQQEKKIDILIDAWYKQLELHNKIYDALNKKIMWFFTLTWWIQWYLFVNVISTSGFLQNSYLLILILIFIIWIMILWIHLYLLQLKTFKTGPDITKQKKFLETKTTVYNLKHHTLWCLEKSYENNNKVINEIWEKFKLTLWALLLYLVLIVIYFIINILFHYYN